MPKKPTIDLSPAQVRRLRSFMRTRDIEGSAEQLIAGLITSGETAIDDATIDAVMDLIDQYIALHGVRWRDVLQRRAATCEDDPSSAIEPGLN